jgi:hypothetical protein
VLSIEAVITGFPGLATFSTPVNIRPQVSFRVVIMNEEPLALREYRPYPFYVKLFGVTSPNELDEITLKLFCGGSTVEEMALDPNWFRPSGAAFFGVFELVVPRGTGGLPAAARVTARKGEAVAQDAKAGQISAFPPGQVASLVLQSSRYFTVEMYSRSAPVRYVALDIDGNPVSGATIVSWIHPNPDAGTIVPATVQTGPDGEFQFEVETKGVPCNRTVASVGLPPSSPKESVGNFDRGSAPTASDWRSSGCDNFR